MFHVKHFALCIPIIPAQSEIDIISHAICHSQGGALPLGNGAPQQYLNCCNEAGGALLPGGSAPTEPILASLSVRSPRCLVLSELLSSS